MVFKEHEKFDCPLCGVLLGPWSRGITFHARSHGIDLERMWQLVHGIDEPPRCVCSDECELCTTWCDWDVGYFRYAKGHYDKGVRSERTTAVLLRQHWARGKTKDNDERLRKMGAKTSQTLKDGFASGRVKHWSKGLTKEEHPQLAAQSLRMQGLKRHFYDAQHVVDIVNRCLGERFVLLSDVTDISNRSNNRTMFLTIECTRCHERSSALIYNVIRKKAHRCEKCDPVKLWSSAGEDDVAHELEHMFGPVQRYPYVNGWSIDMYVCSIDTYVQYDGVYWHGLDRPIEENRNAKITKKYYRDIEQVRWFALHGMKLVRIIETEWCGTSDKRTFLSQRLIPAR